MQQLEINMTFNVINRAQAKYILKQIGKVRKMASKTLLAESSIMNSNIRKVEKS